jgi:hypothetical protein
MVDKILVKTGGESRGNFLLGIEPRRRAGFSLAPGAASGEIIAGGEARSIEGFSLWWTGALFVYDTKNRPNQSIMPATNRAVSSSSIGPTRERLARAACPG